MPGIRHRIVLSTAMLAATLLVTGPARAESWILWGADKWDPRPWQTLGVYADRAACTTAARPAVENRAKQVVAEARAERTWTTTASVGPTEAVDNPPGARIVVTVVRRSPGQPAVSPRFAVLTQCWPAGVNPR